MSMHEGQSLLQEMQISRGREFLSFATPHIAQAFPEAARAQPSAFTAQNLARLFTRVSRSKLRVGADEVTYPCHILIRYDIERELIAGHAGRRAPRGLGRRHACVARALDAGRLP
jgi:carboxypeptidase Taq